MTIGWNYWQLDITSTIQANLIAYFDWHMIDIGAITNIGIPSSGTYGGDKSKLRPVNDPRYTSGRVWEGFRGNWVWESGLSVVEPIRVSGVFVGSTLRTDATILYPEGRVIFPSAIPLGSNVRLGYSYKEVMVAPSDNNPWLRQIQNRSRRLDDSNFMVSSGSFYGFPENRIQLPYVGVCTLPRRNEGYQLGGHHKVIHTTKFYILSEDEHTTKKISDIISNHEHKTIYVINFDQMAQDNGFPLNFNGSLNSNPKTYHNLAKPSGDGGYRYTNGIQNGKSFLYDVQAQDGQWIGDVYYNTVTLKTETIVTKF